MKKKTTSGFALTRLVLGLGMIVSVGLVAYHGSAPIATAGANSEIESNLNDASASTYSVNAGKSPKIDALIAKAKDDTAKLNAADYKPSLKLALEYYGILPSSGK